MPRPRRRPVLCRPALALVLVGWACDPESAGERAVEPGPTHEDASGPTEDCYWLDCPSTDPGATDGGAWSTGADDPFDESTSGSGSETDDDASGTEVASGSEDDGEESGTTGEPTPLLACFPGFDGSGSHCLETVQLADAPLVYPPPTDAQTTAPLRFIDVDAEDPTAHLAPDFLLQELFDAAEGRYQVVQPRAVESLQAVRDAVGPLIVRAAFRSPAAVEAAGDGPYSRHSYGDAFDLESVDASVASPEALIDACIATDASHVELLDDGRVHCEWADAPNDPAFFGDSP